MKLFLYISGVCLISLIHSFSHYFYHVPGYHVNQEFVLFSIMPIFFPSRCYNFLVGVTHISLQMFFFSRFELVLLSRRDHWPAQAQRECVGYTVYSILLGKASSTAKYQYFCVSAHNTHVSISHDGCSCICRFSNVIRAHTRLESRYSNSSGGSYDEDKSKH